jgi:hypothetical protein
VSAAAAASASPKVVASAMVVNLIEVVIFMGLVDFADNLDLGRPRCQKVSNKSIHLLGAVRIWTLRQTKLHCFGRNAGFIRQGIQSSEPAAA